MSHDQDPSPTEQSFKPTTTTPTTTTNEPPVVVAETKIPLHAKWTLWFDNPRIAPAGSDWKENLKEIGHFAYVSDFWRIYNNVQPASRMDNHSNYSIFRFGVAPAWEDAQNKQGGKFVLTLSKKESKQSLDECWLYTILAILGETMDATGDQVMGAVVSVRKAQDRIALWLKTGDKDVCVKIGQRWKKVLDIEKTALRYQMHADAAASGHSFRNEVHFEV